MQLDFLSDLLKTALKAGADAADILLLENTSLAAEYRLKTLERVEHAQTSSLGLRVFIGQRQAIVSTSDFSPKEWQNLIARALHIARLVPPDPYVGLLEEVLPDHPTLSLADSKAPTTEELIHYTKRMEDSALRVKEVTSLAGAQASFQTSTKTLLTSTGFKGSYTKTYCQASISALAQTPHAQERDYASSSTLFQKDLKSPEALGQEAGTRAVNRLNSKMVKTQKAPVIFEPRIASRLVSILASALNGNAIARGTSFLRNALGGSILPSNISLIDDPLLLQGLASRPFDMEGVRSEKRLLIENGTLLSWVLDLASARRLNLKSTGHASRTLSSSPFPAPTNLYLTPGSYSPKDLLKEVNSGFYVTELLGMGVNLLTGDYSQGASGFWIEKGEIAFPVSGVTIAGHLTQMFKNLKAANDLTFDFSMNAPTLLLGEMTIAGSS